MCVCVRKTMVGIEYAIILFSDTENRAMDVDGNGEV